MNKTETTTENSLPKYSKASNDDYTKQLKPGEMLIGSKILPKGKVLSKVGLSPSDIFLPEYEKEPEPIGTECLEDIAKALSTVDGFSYTINDQETNFLDPKNTAFLHLIECLQDEEISKHYAKQLTNRFIRTYKPPYGPGMKWHIADFYKPEILTAYRRHNVPDGSKLDTYDNDLDHYYLLCENQQDPSLQRSKVAHYVRLKDRWIKHPEFSEITNV